MNVAWPPAYQQAAWAMGMGAPCSFATGVAPMAPHVGSDGAIAFGDACEGAIASVQQNWRHPCVGKQPDEITSFDTAGNCLWPSNFPAAFPPGVTSPHAWHGDVSESFATPEALAAASAWFTGTAASAMGLTAAACPIGSSVACEGVAALKSNPTASSAVGSGGARRANRRSRAAPIGSGATPVGGSPSMGPAQQPMREAAEARTGLAHAGTNSQKVDKSTQVETKECSTDTVSDKVVQPFEGVPALVVGPPPGLSAPPGLSPGTKAPRPVQLEQLLPPPAGGAPQPPTVVAAPPAPSHATEGTSGKASDPFPAGTTTVMLRNIPNRYTPEELLEEMLGHGFEGCFDFFYLPTDFGTKKNMGYGFLNLSTPALAESFRCTFDRRRLTRYVTQKVLEMSPAVTQGFQANVMKYLKHQAGRVQNPWFRPMIFVPEEGSGVQWCCFSLCEENLPDSVRRMLKDTFNGGSVCCSSSASSTQAPSPSRSPITAGEDLRGDESGNESEVGDTASPDADTAEAMQAAVSKFLRACGDGGVDGHEHSGGLTAVDAPIPSSTASTVAKAPSRRGRRGRGGHGQQAADQQAQRARCLPN